MRIVRSLSGEVTRRKVDCPDCGSKKLEGLKCDCGWPVIEIEPTADGRMLLFLPLCPSTNARMMPVRMGRSARDIETPEARDYIASVASQLKPLLERAAAEWGWKPITRWQNIEIWTILRLTSADCHNFGKVLFDALEAGGFCWNDKYLMPLYRGLAFDYKAPAIIVRA